MTASRASLSFVTSYTPCIFEIQHYRSRLAIALLIYVQFYIQALGMRTSRECSMPNDHDIISAQLIGSW